MSIIKHIEEIWDVCGQDVTVVSNSYGSVPLPKWLDNQVVLLGSGKKKNAVFLVCTPEAEYDQPHFTAINACNDRSITITDTLIAEPSVLKILLEERPDKTTQVLSTVDDQILFDKMISEAVSQGVSDIIIDNHSGRYAINYDIDTIVKPVRAITRAEAEAMMRHFYTNIADQDVVEDSIFSFNKAQFAAGDGVWNEQKIRIRYQSKPSFPEGCDFALRVLSLSETNGFSAFENLCLSPDQTGLLKYVNRNDSGAIMFAGVTGSGKTTSIKVMLEECIRAYPGIQIRSAESPPEYIIRGVRQHHVGEDVSGNTDVYSENIKELMRMRPDRIYIGEIRGRQTAELFSKAVLSGHGVYTTIHTDSPYEIVTRLEGEGVDRDVISSGSFLNALVYQKRLPRLCEKCKVPFDEMSQMDKVKSRLDLLKSGFENTHFHNPEGCTFCQYRGVKGSMVCMEIVRPTPKIRSCIKNKDERGFYKEWYDFALESGFGDSAESSLFHAFRNMTQGSICPSHVERAFGDITPFMLTEKTRSWSKDHGFAIRLV